MRQKTIHSLLIMTSGLLLFSIQVNGKNLEIKQELYTFNMPVSQVVANETFVVIESQGTANNPFPLSGSTKFAAGDKNSNTCLPVAHFRLGSSVLTSAEETSILSRISQSKITQHTPLIITGYTCELGPDHYNQTLSLQRAKAVAHLLRTHGLTVATVQGRGSENPITHKPQELYRNRRVEIELTR